MKKTYEKPQIKLQDLHLKAVLLAGSDPEDETQEINQLFEEGIQQI